jgi:geranylgeranyl diphosphate synthase type II
MDSSRHQVEEVLNQVLPAENTSPARLHQAMRYAVFSGGKRLRPVLCLAAAGCVGGEPDRALFPAAALELLHSYTLVHDDLPCMDDDEVRRGKPTCHTVFGEANALLAGDALQALAFETLARTHVEPPYLLSGLITEFAQAVGSQGVVGGQVEDLAASAASSPPTAETVRFVHLHKTADLFRASLRLGAMAGGAAPLALQALTTFGVHLGLAFQITDDILDEGKQGKDGNQEMTCLSIMGVEQARAQATAHIQGALEALSAFLNPHAEFLRDVAQSVLTRRT